VQIRRLIKFERLSISDGTNVGISDGIKAGTNIGLNQTQKNIIELIEKDSGITAKLIAESIGIAARNIEANIAALKQMSILAGEGTKKTGRLKINYVIESAKINFFIKIIIDLKNLYNRSLYGTTISIYNKISPKIQ